MSNSTTKDCNYPDTAWKQLLRDRDTDALVCIWEKINSWCYTAVKKYCGDENVAMSSAMKAFEKLLERYEQYQLKGSFLGFCRMICVNEVLTQCKRRNKLRDDVNYDDLLI